MSFGPASPRRQRTQTNLLFLIVGVFIGFFLSSFLSMATTFQEPLRWTNSAQFASSSSRLLPERPKRDCYEANKEEQTGWSTIHVYYGNTSHLADTSVIRKDFFQSAQWFSQLRQDLIVSKLLRGKRNGYFIDLAANDAVRISNTYALETNFGWRGICVEPNPVYWPALSYRKCDVVAAVVGRRNMEEVSFKYPNRAAPQGGIVGKKFDNKVSSKFHEDHPRFTVRLLDILERFDSPNVIDYFSLDIEGAEDFVMETFPFDRYRFNILTVERPSATLSSLLERKGYLMLKQLKKWGETIWVHSSIEGSLDKTALEIDTENYKYREKVA